MGGFADNELEIELEKAFKARFSARFRKSRVDLCKISLFPLSFPTNFHNFYPNRSTSEDPSYFPIQIQQRIQQGPKKSF